MHFESAYRDKTVLLTGHTGFKGSWLCEWLSMLAARLVGFYLPELPTTHSHFEELGLAERLGPAADLRSDVRSLDSLIETISDTRPDYIFTSPHSRWSACLSTSRSLLSRPPPSAASTCSRRCAGPITAAR